MIIGGIDRTVLVTHKNCIDNDILVDFIEVHVYYTDPTDQVTDDDGFSDGDEILNGTDPNNPFDY
jgi:hypothetical protein